MLEISVQVVPPLVEYCHLITVPVWPDKVSIVLFIPMHTIEPPATEPPTLAGITVTVADNELSGMQTPS